MKDKPASQAHLPACLDEVRQRAMQFGVDPNIAEWVCLSLIQVQRLHESRPSYLPLPDALSCLSADPLYLGWCHAGRLQYRDDQYEVDEETGEVFLWPIHYDRADILAVIQENIHLADAQLAARMPLACRVGYVVGWLSGLAVSQKEDARAGMVMLAVLVVPLLSSSGNSLFKRPLLKEG